jgi:predicted dienelactone hydrolase
MQERSQQPTRVTCHLALTLTAAGLLACGGADTSTSVQRGPADGLTVTPAAATTAPAGEVPFAASASASASVAVRWSVVESGGGVISTSGLYTAPSGTGTFHVQATSVADATRSGQAVVTVSSGTDPTASSASTVGPLAVQSYSSGIPLGASYVNPTIYYPTSGTPPYPAVAFVPGNCETYRARSSQPQSFTQWGTFLASHGFVVLFIDTGSDGCPGGRSTALSQALTTLIGENTRAGSPLAGKVDTASLAVMGHSFGGSGALYVGDGAHVAGLQGIVSLCPVTTNGYYPNDSVPSMIIAGQGDPYSSDSKAQYDSIPGSTPKLLAEFAPVSTVQISMHHIGDTPLGTNATDPVVARMSLSFLEVHLKGDQRYAQFLVTDPSLFVFAKNP